MILGYRILFFRSGDTLFRVKRSNWRICRFDREFNTGVGILTLELTPRMRLWGLGF